MLRHGLGLGHGSILPPGGGRVVAHADGDQRGPTSAERPWGSWHVLDSGEGYKVKRIEVRPGHRLSYQTHEHRSEHWLVVSGVATCVVDGRTVAGPGEHVDVGGRLAPDRQRAGTSRS